MERYRDYAKCSAYSRISDDHKRWNSDGTEAEPQKEYIVSGFSYCCQRMSNAWGNSIRFGNDGGLDENVNMAGVSISFCPFCSARIHVEVNRIPGR